MVRYSFCVSSQLQASFSATWSSDNSVGTGQRRGADRLGLAEPTRSGSKNNGLMLFGGRGRMLVDVDVVVVDVMCVSISWG